jgi:hypothetical protein
VCNTEFQVHRNLSSIHVCDLNSSLKLNCQIGDYPNSVLIIQNKKIKHKDLILYFHGNNDDQSTTDRYNAKYNFNQSMIDSKTDKLFVMPLSLSDSKMMSALKKGEANFGATIDYQKYFVESKN